MGQNILPLGEILQLQTKAFVHTNLEKSSSGAVNDGGLVLVVSVLGPAFETYDI